MSRILSTLLISVVFYSGVATAAETNDPWEGMNRSIFTFNETLDQYLLRPAAQGYQAVTPDIIETGVHNFFNNLSDLITMLNQLLQGKFELAAQDLARISFNTTIGLGGVIDVSTPMGLQRHEEDFGQTLGYWGVKPGPYLVLPFFGPSNLRDAFGRVADWQLESPTKLTDQSAENAKTLLEVLDTRISLFPTEQLISGERYNFLRDSYMQRREFLVNDGVMTSYSSENF